MMKLVTNPLRHALSALVMLFIRGKEARSEYLYGYSEVPVPKDKLVRVTFEYIDAGVNCDAGTEEQHTYESSGDVDV